MTDEQILKRLAEIEGLEVDQNGLPFYLIPDPTSADHLIYGGEWNPLDDWSDLGPLIEKYRLQIEPPSKFEEDCFSIRELWTVCAYDSNDGAKSESLPHAICLAIIEANRGMGDE